MDPAGILLGAARQSAANIFSFYGNKTIVMGEGGALTCQDPDLARWLRILRGQGQYPADPRYVHRVVGSNYRLTDLQAAVGLAQLERLSAAVAGRQRAVGAYRALFAHYPSFGVQGRRPPSISADWQFALVL